MEQASPVKTERLFYGIPVTEEIITLTKELQENIPGVRWIAPENLHITLIFIGNVPVETSSMIKKLDFELPSEFELTVEKAEVRNKRSGLIWLRCSAPSQIKLLRNNVMQSLSKLTAIKEENRPYTPHITIARSKRKISFHPSIIIPQSMRIGKLILYRSVTGPSGSIYKIEKEYLLKS